MKYSTMSDSLSTAAERYIKDGFLSPVDVLTADEATQHRRRLEAAETTYGPLHYKNKIHTILLSPLELATHPRVLAVVETVLGPDILLYNTVYIVKESDSPDHVSWHQDLTYWGFSDDAQVSMWLALSPATAESGCMRMVPGSHRQGHRQHKLMDDPNNVLFQGQTVADVTEEQARLCPLQPGQASFHHGWTLHASLPNRSNDRRIGLNVQYIAPHMRQVKADSDSALLVRGQDRFGHFIVDRPAEADFEPAAVARQRQLDRHYNEIAGTS